VGLRNKLRAFLNTSMLYEHITVDSFMAPIRSFLSKETAIIRMRQGKLKECFDICVKEIGDLNFCMSVAKKGLEW